MHLAPSGCLRTDDKAIGTPGYLPFLWKEKRKVKVKIAPFLQAGF